MEDIQKLLDFREQLTSTECNEQISALLLEEIRSVGFSSFVYGTIPIIDDHRLKYISVGSLPKDWAQYYSANELNKTDYALRWCIDHQDPLRWKAYHEAINRGAIEEKYHHVHFAAREHGVRLGATIPILARPGSRAGLSVVASSTEREESVEALLDAKVRYLQLCADLVHARLDLGELTIGSLNLTPQKIDVIRFLAEGYQQDEIAYRMKISIQRLRKVIQECREQLEAQTTAQMVGKARFLEIV